MTAYGTPAASIAAAKRRQRSRTMSAALHERSKASNSVTTTSILDSIPAAPRARDADTAFDSARRLSLILPSKLSAGAIVQYRAARQVTQGCIPYADDPDRKSPCPRLRPGLRRRGRQCLGERRRPDD